MIKQKKQTNGEKMYTLRELQEMNSYEKTASYNEADMEEMQKMAFEMGVEYAIEMEMEKEAGLSRGAKAGLAALGLAGAGAGGYYAHKNDLYGKAKGKAEGLWNEFQMRNHKRQDPRNFQQKPAPIVIEDPNDPIGIGGYGGDGPAKVPAEQNSSPSFADLNKKIQDRRNRQRTYTRPPVEPRGNIVWHEPGTYTRPPVKPRGNIVWNEPGTKL